MPDDATNHGRRTGTMECPECGDDVELPLYDVDGFPQGGFQEGDAATCQRCGLMVQVSVDEDYASLSSNDEYEDAGQPTCDGSCGALPEFHGKPCSWDCDRAAQ